MEVLKMSELHLDGKRLVIREDLNVPIKNGKITSDVRIQAVLPTVQLALKKGASVVLLSHLGRPTEGEYAEDLSLAPVAAHLSKILGFEVPLIKDYLEGFTSFSRVVLCENTRFNKGEKKNDENLGKKYASLGDVFVMDAFATAHRAEASTHAVAKFAKTACAGPLLVKELEALERSFSKAEHPLIAILGGSKVSTKLNLLKSLSKKVDQLIVGGGIVNNFIKAAGYEIGCSIYEPELLQEAKDLLQEAKAAGCAIPIPIDVVVGTELSVASPAVVKAVADVLPQDMILDIGPKTAEMYAKLLQEAKTIIWNGPVGAFEIPQFSKGTAAICKAITESSAFSMAGGGDTIAAIQASGAEDKISYISTGGGAFLEFLEGQVLPAVQILQERAKD